MLNQIDSLQTNTTIVDIHSGNDLPSDHSDTDFVVKEQSLPDIELFSASGKASNKEKGNPDSTENLYRCNHLTGGAKHPGRIVETPGLANIKPPRPVYRPYLPKELIETGKISEIQLERIIYAGQAHTQFLPGSAARAGISIGDGTGVGKTTTLLGIILDNWFRGVKRTVWFSVKTDLIKAVKDEMQRLGINIPIQLVNDYKPEEEITLARGIIFCTYQSLIAKSRKGHRRIDQLTNWLDREGILIFDEGHKAKNFFAENERSQTQTGAAVVEIQNIEKFPNYLVIYSSATAATDVRHLAHMIRLGLWGREHISRILPNLQKKSKKAESARWR